VRTPQLRAYAGDDFARAERLAHVVVRAKLQPQQAVDLFDPRGQHDHRNGRKRAQFATDAESVEAGQHQVEQDQVRRVLPNPRDRGIAALQMIDAESVGDQIVAQQRCELGFVLDDQDARAAHAEAPSRGR
jgi:hypothetical protein